MDNENVYNYSDVRYFERMQFLVVTVVDDVFCRSYICCLPPPGPLLTVYLVGGRGRGAYRTKRGSNVVTCFYGRVISTI